MTVIGHNSNMRSVNSLSHTEKVKLRSALQDMDDSLTRVAAERDHQKEILTKMADELGLDKKLVRKMAKTLHRSTFKDDQEENRTFEEFYEIVVNGPIPVVTSKTGD